MSSILGIKVDSLNKNLFIKKVNTLIKNDNSHYVCFTNVHTIVTANNDVAFKKIINNSAISAPDGMPLVWILKIKGKKSVKRCAGADIMHEIFTLSVEKGYTHYFYGGTQNTLNLLSKKLKQLYPGLKILDMYSPPFREMSDEENRASIDKINSLKPDCIWVGLGAPKQEKWISNHIGNIDKGVLFGVGAAFNFYAGTVKRTPKWMQNLGLEWFFRLLQEPKRLWKRYLFTNILFIWYLLKEILTDNTKK